MAPKLLSDDEVFGNVPADPSGLSKPASLLSDEDVFGASPSQKSKYSDAIGEIESGGRYDSIGTPTRGNYPVGKHQVMDYNVGPWTEAALGRRMTPQEFLNDPNAQEAVFAHQFDGNVAKYGNPDDAASVWLSGRPMAKAGGARDNLGTDVPTYVRKFRTALGRGATEELSQRPAPKGRAPILSDEEVFGAQRTPWPQPGSTQLQGLEDQQGLIDAGNPQGGDVGGLQRPVPLPQARPRSATDDLTNNEPIPPADISMGNQGTDATGVGYVPTVAPQMPAEQPLARGIGQRIEDNIRPYMESGLLTLTPEQAKEYPNLDRGLKYMKTAGVWPQVVEDFMRAPQVAIGAGSGLLAGIAERFGMSPAEADKLQRDANVLGTSAMLESGMPRGDAVPGQYTMIGKPVQDFISRLPEAQTGTRAEMDAFLRRREAGWTYDDKTGQWTPPAPQLALPKPGEPGAPPAAPTPEPPPIEPVPPTIQRTSLEGEERARAFLRQQGYTDAEISASGNPEQMASQAGYVPPTPKATVAPTATPKVAAAGPTEMDPKVVDFIQKKQPKLKVIKGGLPDDLLAESVDPNAPARETIEGQPGANLGRLAKLLGPKLYGDPRNIARVSVKEMMQNGFDAIKGAMEHGGLEEGNINIDMNDVDRTITMTDNGTGMTPEVLANQFLQIAGTSKESSQASGGLGIAKMLFLFGNQALHVTTMRNGKVARMATTGEELFRSLEGGEKPKVQIRPATRADAEMFPQGHGTRIAVKVPESYRDASSGELEPILFPSYKEAHPVLGNSPLFRNIRVKFNGETLMGSGQTFNPDEYIPFSDMKFDWGNARLYMTKGEVPKSSWDNNFHVLSNGLHQFSQTLKRNPLDFAGKPVQRNFYLDVNSRVNPEDAGYPFDLNRQNFSAQTQQDFDSINKYLSLMFQREGYNESAMNFGHLEYLSGDIAGVRLNLKPEKVQESPIPVIKPGDKIEIHDGQLRVNGKKVPTLTREEMESFSIDPDSLRVEQDKIDPRNPILHDNTQVHISPLEVKSVSQMAREKFGQRFDDFMGELGHLYIELRDVVAQHLDYPELFKEGVGISFDSKYRGVSIRVPFSGSFVNPGATLYPDTLRAAVGFVGTQIHELAHHQVRSHDADFPAEMQKILIALDTAEDFDFHAYKQAVVNSFSRNEEIFKYLHDIFNGSTYDVRSSGRSLDTGADEARNGKPSPNVAVPRNDGAGEPATPLRTLGGLGTPSKGGGRTKSRLSIEESRPLAETREGNTRKIRAESGDKDAQAAEPQPETESGKNVIHVAFGKKKGGGGSPPPGAVELGIHADHMNRIYKYMLGLDRLVDRNPRFTPLLRYYEKASAMHRDESRIQDMALRIAKEWRRLGPQSENLVALIDDVTNMVYRTPTEVHRGVVRHPSDAEFQALVKKHKASPEALAVYDKVKKSFEVFLELVRGNAIESARRTITDKRKLSDQFDAINAHIAEMKKRPYFPFMRFGTHYITVKDPNGRVTFFTTVERRGLVSAVGMQKRVADKLRASVPSDHTIETGKLPETAAPFVGLPAELLEAIARDLDLTPEQRSALEQLRYDMSPAASFKHRFQHKDYTPGYSHDFLRSYSRYFFHGARYYSKTKYAQGMRDDLKAAREVKGNTASGIADYMDDHFYNLVMATKGDYGLFKGAIFLWTFGYSVAGAAINLSQVPMVSYPFLAAKFGGIGKGDAVATAALVKAMTDLNNFYKKGHYDNASEFEMRAMEYGIKTSRITEAQASELAGLAQGNNLLSLGNNRASRGANFLLEKAAFLFEMAEQFNRRVTWRAALDLAQKYPDAQAVKDATNKYADEMKDMVDRKEFTPAEAAAVVTAIHATEQTQYVYGKYVRPRFMRGKLSGTIFVFKHYMLSTLYLMGANKSDVAPRMLMVMLALGGMLGLPGIQDLDDVIRVLSRWLFGKDFNIELAVREFIKDHTNGNIPADVVLHGLARRGFGVPAIMSALGVKFPSVDMSQSIGMGRLLPFELGKLLDPNDVNQTISEQTQRTAGAVFGFGFNLYKFLQDKDHSLTDAKRWEKIMPRALASGSKAFRAYSEGRERSGKGQLAGNTIINYDPRDPEQMAEIVAQGLGFNPTRLTAQWDVIRAKQEATEFFQTQKQMLLNQFDEARRSTDPKEREKVIQSIKEYNVNLPQWAKGESISGDTVRHSMQTRSHTQALRNLGLPSQKSQIGISRHIQSLFPESTVDVRKLPR